MSFGTKGCMYNCGDECTGECIRIEPKTKMSKIDKKTQGKVNTIISEIEGFMLEFPPQYETDKESMLGYFSNIICQLDTDIAIEVMKDFGKAGEHQAMAIKVNYGY